MTQKRWKCDELCIFEFKNPNLAQYLTQKRWKCDELCIFGFKNLNLAQYLNFFAQPHGCMVAAFRNSESDVLVKQEEFSDSSYNEEMHDSNLLMKVETVNSCDLCGKPSITQLGLRKHKLRYHGTAKKGEDLDAAFECHICGRKSISKGGLNKHVIRHHSNA